MKTTLCTLVTLAAMAMSSQAATISYDLAGKGGVGLLSTNETDPVAGTPGTGGELGTGITFNTITNMLYMNVGWGSTAGFTGSLTGIAGVMHLQGAADFNTNAGVLASLDSLAGFTNAANGGGFNGSVLLTPTQVEYLNNGQLYINVRTSMNFSGELRGNIVVPEPGSTALGALVGLTLLRRRRRCRR